MRHLLYTRETTGFQRLYRHPDLTFEAFILSGNWDDIFDQHDKQTARKKLQAHKNA